MPFLWFALGAAVLVLFDIAWTDHLAPRLTPAQHQEANEAHVSPSPSPHVQTPPVPKVSLSPTPTAPLAKKPSSIPERIASLLQGKGQAVRITPPNPQPTLFGTFSLPPTIRITAQDIVAQADEGEEVFMRIFSMQPSQSNQYEQVKNAVEKTLSSQVEARVFDLDTYTEKSFIIRLEENQKTMYLVVESDGLLLGFEYPLGENFSRHTMVDALLRQIFSSQ